MGNEPQFPAVSFNNLVGGWPGSGVVGFLEPSVGKNFAINCKSPFGIMAHASLGEYQPPEMAVVGAPSSFLVGQEKYHQ
jgi:hypothetical protein